MSNPYKEGGNPFGADNKSAAGNKSGAWYDPPAADQSPSYALPTASSPGVDTQPQWSDNQQNYHMNAANVNPQQPNVGQPQPQWVDPQQQLRLGLQQPPDLITAKFWTLEFYQQFFDVDTKDVLKRMGNVLLPLVPPDFLHDRHWHMGNLPGGVMPNAISSAAAAFSSGTEKRADLYGPLWISTTVWVTLAIVGNIMGKMAHDRRAAQRLADINTIVNNSPTLGPSETRGPYWTPEPLPRWTYDFSAATVAAGVVYTFIVFMSFLVWGLMKWKNVPVGLTDALCLYGYSMFVFLLAGILCAVPVTGFQWLVCVFAALWSTSYLLLNMWQLWKVSLEKPWFIGLVALVISTQCAITIGFKLYFFNYAY